MSLAFPFASMRVAVAVAVALPPEDEDEEEDWLMDSTQMFCPTVKLMFQVD